MADERGRGSAAGPLAALIRTRDRAGGGLAIGGVGAALRLRARRVGAPVRPQRELGIAVAGAGRGSAGSDPQQVREGKIMAQVALKFLVPVARQSLEDCQRMAAIFAQHHCDTREAGQLYGAWRKGSPAIRKRILDDPELFFKTQRQAQEKAAGTGAEL